MHKTPSQRNTLEETRAIIQSCILETGQARIQNDTLEMENQERLGVETQKQEITQRKLWTESQMKKSNSNIIIQTEIQKLQTESKIKSQTEIKQPENKTRESKIRQTEIQNKPTESQNKPTGIPNKPTESQNKPTEIQNRQTEQMKLENATNRTREILSTCVMEEGMTSAVEFLSVECDMIFEPDCELETEEGEGVGDTASPFISHFNTRWGQQTDSNIHGTSDVRWGQQTDTDIHGTSNVKWGQQNTDLETSESSNNTGRSLSSLSNGSRTFTPQSNQTPPPVYHLPLIGDLFRRRGVVVYKRSSKNRPFVKIYHPDAHTQNGKLKKSNGKGSEDGDGSSRERRSINPSISSTPSNIFKCGKCRKQFTSKNRLLTHRLVHSKRTGDSHVCPVCKADFINKVSLKLHIQRNNCLDNQSKSVKGSMSEGINCETSKSEIKRVFKSSLEIGNVSEDILKSDMGSKNIYKSMPLNKNTIKRIISDVPKIPEARSANKSGQNSKNSMINLDQSINQRRKDGAQQSYEKPLTKTFIKPTKSKKKEKTKKIPNKNTNLPNKNTSLIPVPISSSSTLDSSGKFLLNSLGNFSSSAISDFEKNITLSRLITKDLINCLSSGSMKNTNNKATSGRREGMNATSHSTDRKLRSKTTKNTDECGDKLNSGDRVNISASSTSHNTPDCGSRTASKNIAITGDDRTASKNIAITGIDRTASKNIAITGDDRTASNNITITDETNTESIMEKASSKSGKRKKTSESKCVNCEETLNPTPDQRHSKTIQCTNCGTSNKHKKRRHRERKCYECPECGSQYRKSSALKKHRRLEHDVT